VRYYGCPAEEGGAAKTFMVRAGAFEDVDIAITWHPASPGRRAPPLIRWPTPASTSPSPAASHAAAAPHLGRSALDAVELMNVGVNYMREHMPSDARIHYAYLDAGGIAPNVVQGKARVRYAVRAHTCTGMLALIERVKKIAEGAALMTETTVDHPRSSPPSPTCWQRPAGAGDAGQLPAPRPAALRRCGPDFARKIQATLTPQDIASNYNRSGLARGGVPLAEEIQPRSEPRAPPWSAPPMWAMSPGWCRPCRRSGATYAIGTPGHSWQWTAQGKMPAAHKGMVHVAKVMAGTPWT
jgi:aminobenzoyl-glutamate utilization protein B